MSAPRTVIHVSPHPDDEAIGAPATLLALVDAGWTVINLAVSLGRENQRARRRAELEESCERLGFGLLVLDPPAGISASDDLAEARATIADAIGAVIAAHHPSLMIGPSPHDGHHGHVVVGQAIRDVALATGIAWWMWGLWADLPRPSLYVPFSDDVLQRALHGLEAHRGELDRNDYRTLLRARAQVNAVMGSERVFGFGSSACSDAPYAELLTECVFDGGRWRIGQPRVLETGSDPTPDCVDHEGFAAWVESDDRLG
jgi:LmbE family N-acetylglucosaminyl deacetylase